MCNIQSYTIKCSNEPVSSVCDIYGCHEVATGEIEILDDDGEDKGVELVCDKHNPNKNINEF